MENRIAKNSVFLYLRMIIVMIINLFAVRIVFKALGAEDYGLYQVVAGVVISFQSFSTVISTSTLRFYSYSIGEQSHSKLSEIFSASVNIYLIFSILCLVIGETIGLWFVNTQLHLPADRIVAANWIYQFAIFALIVTLLHAPYSSLVIAYENMGFFAIVSLAESVLKLLAIIAISYSTSDRLILYGLSLLIIPFFSLCSYVAKVRHSFNHVRYGKVIRKKWYGEMLSFSGWHLFSAGASVGINQVNTILINLFFPLAVNAARGISLQIMGAFNSFCSSFITAVRPPLIKAYANKNFEYLNTLFKYSNKFIYYMVLVIAFPLIFEMETILKIWLGDYSQDTVLFSKLIIIYSVILVLNNPISIVIQATGKIRQYFVPVESVTLLCPVITYLLFKIGFPAQSTYYAMIATIAIAQVVRVMCLKKYYPEFNLNDYLFGFIMPAGIITIILYLLFQIMGHSIDLNPFLNMVLIMTITIVVVTICGFNELERSKLFSIIRNIFK